MSAAARHAFPGHCLALSHVALAAPEFWPWASHLGLQPLSSLLCLQFGLFAFYFFLQNLSNSQIRGEKAELSFITPISLWLGWSSLRIYVHFSVRVEFEMQPSPCGDWLGCGFYPQGTREPWEGSE